MRLPVDLVAREQGVDVEVGEGGRGKRHGGRLSREYGEEHEAARATGERSKQNKHRIINTKRSAWPRHRVTERIELTKHSGF